MIIDMVKTLTATAAVTIQAPKSKVWEALTTPRLLKRILFGADVITDWKVGSSIIYKGEWQGKPYEDKGRILKFDLEKLLVTTHWSPLSGVPDVPENYHTVSYELSGQDAGTKVTVTQDNNATEDEKMHSEQNWKMMLEGLKKMLEG
jgi:uncharacterized protein YndB with AHSA1/START domain